MTAWSPSPAVEMAEALLHAWSPFSSLPISSAATSYAAEKEATSPFLPDGYDADADAEMEMDEETSDSDDPDPGVAETVFDWTAFLTVLPPNRTHFPGIVSTIDIPAEVYLGDIKAERKYIWEIPEESQDKIIWVYEDCVLDCSNPTERNVLSYAREGFYGGLKVNCRLRFITDADGESHVGLETILPVKSGDELIYWFPEMV